MKEFPRDPATGLIPGAEPYDFFPPGSGDPPPHAVLFLHGWSSSPRELRFLARRVADAGFFCRCILMPGHGRTVEDLRRVHFEDHRAAALEAFDELARNHARVSVCGFSLGGLLALFLAAEKKVANLVLCAPYLVPGGKTFGIPNRFYARYLPAWNIIMPKDPEGPIFDPQALAGHIAYPTMPMAGVVENTRAARKIWPLLPGIQCPTLLFQSSRDQTSHVSGARRLMAELGSPDKKWVKVDRSKHVVTLDFDRERVERETVEWLAGRS